MELDYCVPLGLPLSEFHSWSQEDREYALAWNYVKASICQRCGTMSHEWLDNDGKKIDPAPYKIKAHRCMGCVEMENERKAIPKDEDAGVTLYFERSKKWTKRNQKKGRHKNK